MLIIGFTLNSMFHGTLFEIMNELETERDLRFSESIATIKAQWMIISFLFIAGLIALIYFTNRFLTKFVFSKIEQPLEILSKGVHQIKNGNLNYQIVYHAEDEFKPVCEDFNEMANRLKYSIEEVQKNEKNRKELIAGISHDLRSPLTSIQGCVEGLIDGVASTPERQQEYLNIIKIKVDDINNMVSQLFLFSKMDMGNYPVNPEKLDIGKEITDLVKVSLDGYKEKGLSVILKDIPRQIFIYADPFQLRSVFTNILDNSAKYKDKTTVKAVIYCEESDEIIRIFFDDNGPGVPKEDVSKLFDVFFRGDPSRNNPSLGSGLGLAISAKALERMNGKIYAKNLDDGGLQMIIEIPKIREENLE